MWQHQRGNSQGENSQNRRERGDGWSWRKKPRRRSSWRQCEQDGGEKLTLMDNKTVSKLGQNGLTISISLFSYPSASHYSSSLPYFFFTASFSFPLPLILTFWPYFHPPIFHWHKRGNMGAEWEHKSVWAAGSRVRKVGEWETWRSMFRPTESLTAKYEYQSSVCLLMFQLTVMYQPCVY